MKGILTAIHFIILNSVARYGDGYTLNDSMTLMSDMLSRYDRRHRPIINQSLPVSVNVSLELFLIHDLDEVTQRFSVEGLLILSWFDEKIVWDPANYGGIEEQMYPLSDIWFPKLLQAKAFGSPESVTNTASEMDAKIDYTGWVTISISAVFHSACQVDMTYYPFDTQGNMNIPSLLDLGVPTRTFQGLKSYACQQCHKQFNKQNSLKRHIMDKHVRKLHCDFCAFTCGSSRRGLLDRHMQNKHNFPVPKQVLGVVPATVTSETLSEATTFGPLETPFTDAIRVDEVDNFLESLCRGTEESVVSASSTLTSVPPARTAVTAAVQPFVDPALTAATAAAPSPLDSGLPAATAAAPLVDYPESPSPPSCLPSVDTYPVNSPAPSPLGFSYARFYHSPASVPSAPVSSPAPLFAFNPAPPVSSPAPLPLFAPTPLAPPPVPSQVPAQPINPPRVQTIPPQPDFEAAPLDPMDPRYFFLGAPSAEDNSPQARLVAEARERAMRAGPRNYSVRFIPMNLFCIKKVESVRCDDGREYSLSSYWIEEPQSALRKEVGCQTSQSQ